MKILRLRALAESWPLTRPFRISRGVKTAAEVVLVEIVENGFTGRGEAVPYHRYGESVAGVLAQIEALRGAIEAGASREEFQSLAPPGAARNAIDCALWDLAAKRAGIAVAELIEAPAPAPLVTAVTISLDNPMAMGRAAAAIADAPLIKVKVDADAPLDAIAAVHAAAPDARLIVDPNESWNAGLLSALAPRLAELGAALIEQPLPAGEDAALEGLARPVPICADESAHTRADLDRVRRLYQAVNVKLDKAGGLTEALAMCSQARALGLKLMLGCMVSTSLGIAPALQLAAAADFVDLDGPWWLARDREPAVRYAGGMLIPPPCGWGAP